MVPTAQAVVASQSAAITEVLAKLEGAQIGSRELDAEIALHFGYRIDRDYKVPFWCAPNGWSPFPLGFSDLPEFSTSVDAALALIAKVLPGWTMAFLSQQDTSQWFVELREGHLTSFDRVAMHVGPTAPLTLCVALLRALAARSASDDHQTPDASIGGRS